MTLGEIIKAYRQEHGLSQDTIAERSKLSKAYISILERNVNPKNGEPPIPSIKTINAVAKAMQRDFEEVFDLLDDDFKVRLCEDIPQLEQKPVSLAEEEQPRFYAQAPSRQNPLPSYPLLSDTAAKVARAFDAASEKEQNIVLMALSIEAEKTPKPKPSPENWIASLSQVKKGGSYLIPAEEYQDLQRRFIEALLNQIR